MARTETNASIDFDLHGIVAIRLLDARPRDARAVSRQLGLSACRLERDADITIRFVDVLPVQGRLRYIGLEECGFTDDAFLVLRGKHKESARVRIPMEDVGGRCEITCERGVSSVPMLVAILNFAALSHDFVPLHAAAFALRDAGVIVTGWSKGGKTETLLSFMRRGARYVADEWCYLGPDGGRIVGLPEPMRLWAWQLAQLPEVRAAVPLRERLKIAALGAWPRIDRSLPARLRRTKPGKMSSRFARVLEKQLNTQVLPSRLFGETAISNGTALTHLLFVVSSDRPAVEVSKVEPAEVAARMVHSLSYERARFLELYRMFRFAFPERTNPYIESAEHREADLLYRAVAGKKAYRVEHPYPFDIRGIAAEIAPLLS